MKAWRFEQTTKQPDAAGLLSETCVHLLLSNFHAWYALTQFNQHTDAMAKILET
jgi:hypothetical protein